MPSFSRTLQIPNPGPADKDRMFTLGLYRDNGKENGNYYNRVYAGVILG